MVRSNGMKRMKKLLNRSVIVLVVAVVLMFTGCGSIANGDDSVGNSSDEADGKGRELLANAFGPDSSTVKGSETGIISSDIDGTNNGAVADGDPVASGTYKDTYENVGELSIIDNSNPGGIEQTDEDGEEPSDETGEESGEETGGESGEEASEPPVEEPYTSDAYEVVNGTDIRYDGRTYLELYSNVKRISEESPYSVDSLIKFLLGAYSVEETEVYTTLSYDFGSDTVQDHRVSVHDTLTDESEEYNKICEKYGETATWSLTLYTYGYNNVATIAGCKSFIVVIGMNTSVEADVSNFGKEFSLD